MFTVNGRRTRQEHRPMADQANGRATRVPGPPKATREKQRIREVYFVQGETSRLIKIGVANNAARRLSSIQTFSPDRLNLMGVMLCPRYGALESWLHGHFRAHRAHGEWFSPAPALLEFIDEHAMTQEVAQITRILEMRRRGRPGKGLPWIMPAAAPPDRT